MKITVTADHIKAAIKEWNALPLMKRKATECCPFHQAMRPYISKPFGVGSLSVALLKHELERAPLYSFSPNLPPELYVSIDWKYALKRVETNGPYEFEVTKREEA